MSSSVSRSLSLCVGLLTISTGCLSDQTPPATATASAAAPAPAALHRSGGEAQTLTAGFATVDLTWRAGAKPGQVGTEASIFQLALLWGDVARLLLHAYPMQRLDQIDDMLSYATDWTVDHLNRRFDQIQYDKYTDVYQPGRGLHTRSSVKAMVLESNGQKVAVVRADLYLMQKSLWRRVTELVAQQTGLKPEQILIAATHNHSAADAAFLAAGISTLAENFDPRHFAWISHKIADAILAADQARVPAKMGAIKTQLRAVQRNIIGPATAEVVPPGETEPVQVQAGYPRDFFDDALWVLHFDDASTGQRLGSYFVFGMHPESLYEGHGLLSSDFVGLTEKGLEERWGVPVMWSPGALGDIEPDNGEVFGTDYWREDFTRLDQQTAVLVDAIAPVLETDPLASDQVIAPRGDISIDARLRIFPGAPNSEYPGETPWMVPVTEYLSPDFPITCVRALTESANIMLQAVRLGDVLLLGSPSEITSDLALHIRSRVDDVEGNLYQGYVWPDAEAWVEDEINSNFDQGELSSSQGFAMPIVLSQVNDYMGYMVTRWEFVNRDHYRQEMTLYGEDTANYVAARLEGLARELRGEAPESVQWDEPSEADGAYEDQVYAVVEDVDAWVTEYSRNIPATDPLLMGRILESATYQESDEMGAPSVRFGWRGGTSDLAIPSVSVQQLSPDGQWQDVLTEESPHLWILYTPGGQWEAVWHLIDFPGAGTYRFRVSGVYRGEVEGASAPDPLWDPDGRNASYTVVSTDFEVP